MKVLVVEDTEDARIFLVDQLSVAGYEVESAVNGNQALIKALASPPDLIISDILMPEMDGFELCKKLKKETSLKDIPFVFYTATYTEPSDRQFALSLGATRFIIKPEDPIKLLQIIAEELENSTVVQEDVSVSEITDNELEVQYSEVLSRKLDKKIKDLESQKEQLKVITDAMPALIAEIDESNRYQYVNEAYEKWFQISRKNIIGKKVSEVVGKEAFHTIQPCLEKALNGIESSYEGYILDANGENRYILARYIPYKDKESKAKKCFAFINDLTEKKQADDEKKQLLLQLRHSQKMDAIGQLSGGIAHDFNNILSIILGYTELASIGSCDLDKNIEDYIKQIQIAGYRGKALVEQLMVFSRRSGEKAEYSVDIKPLIKEVSKLVKQTFPTTISISLDIDVSTPNIEANLIQLHQVVMNLLVNARDAIDGHGKIDIKLGHEFVDKLCCSCCQHDFSGHYVIFTVSDDGVGIKAEDLEKIFELFFTTKEVGKGTGMGLSTVQTIVHESGGHLQLESEVGVGSTFKIFIPVSSLTEDGIEQNENSVEIKVLTDNSLRVMVVDDEESLAEFLKDLLTMHGYKVSMFVDSQVAVQALKDNPSNYDIVVTDQVMPVMTGVEMVKEMLKVRPDLPVILCSGDYVSTDSFIKMEGINAILQKPVSTKELLQELRHFSTFEK